MWIKWSSFYIARVCTKIKNHVAQLIFIFHPLKDCHKILFYVWLIKTAMYREYRQQWSSLLVTKLKHKANYLCVSNIIYSFRFAEQQTQAAPQAALEADGAVSFLHAGGVLRQRPPRAGQTRCQFHRWVSLLNTNFIGNIPTPRNFSGYKSQISA